MASALAAGEEPAAPPKFYPDDPIWSAPPPIPVEKANRRKIHELYDFAKQSANPHPRPPVPAQGTNTLGDVPDSAWFTNRHGMRPMTLEELRRGPGDDGKPAPPYSVVGGKTEGITPGFRMVDAKGRLYFVKPDPETNPEMATAADAIGARFFYAIGYNTPQNHIVRIKPSELSIGPETKVVGLSGKPRPMTRRDMNIILERSARTRSRELRVVGSLAIQGQPLGPFRYEGTRADDPNDVIPHQHRRDLRGLHTFAAWLNHTDAKGGNSLDVLVKKEGEAPIIKHYLIDFGAMLGSDSDMPKNARFGNGYIIPRPREALLRMLTFGFYYQPWESAHYPEIKSVGRIESETFDPDKWTSNYPNPAFLSRLPDDDYWAAKQVMAFKDDEIRALVETGEYTDSAAVDYITNVLTQRRDRIGRKYFAKVLALDNFRVANGELQFDDLLALHRFSAPREFTVDWAVFDNRTGESTPIAGSRSFRLPAGAEPLPVGGYLSATIQALGEDSKAVTVYLRKRSSQFQVAGIQRTR